MTSIVLFCSANFEKEKKKKPLAMSETSACLEAYFELCNSYIIEGRMLKNILVEPMSLTVAYGCQN